MYKHILVAVDLSSDSPVLIKKATELAKLSDSKVSLIHVDINFSDVYTGLIDMNVAEMQAKSSSETHRALVDLAKKADYPIAETLSGSGDLTQALYDAIRKYEIDLLVTGHHQDFWSKLMSSTRQVMNAVSVDMLVVPLED